MQYIYIGRSYDEELAVMVSLIEHKPETVLGVLILSTDPSAVGPDSEEFENIQFQEDKAAALIELAKEQKEGLREPFIDQEVPFVEQIRICMFIREPNSLLDVKGWVSGPYSLDYQIGKPEDLPIVRFLKLLQDRNIDFFISVGPPWVKDTGDAPFNEASYKAWRGQLEEAFEEFYTSFSPQWLSKSWGIPASEWILEGRPDLKDYKGQPIPKPPRWNPETRSYYY